MIEKFNESKSSLKSPILELDFALSEHRLVVRNTCTIGVGTSKYDARLHKSTGVDQDEFLIVLHYDGLLRIMRIETDNKPPQTVTKNVWFFHYKSTDLFVNDNNNFANGKINVKVDVISAGGYSPVSFYLDEWF